MIILPMPFYTLISGSTWWKLVTESSLENYIYYVHISHCYVFTANKLWMPKKEVIASKYSCSTVGRGLITTPQIQRANLHFPLKFETTKTDPCKVLAVCSTHLAFLSFSIVSSHFYSVYLIHTPLLKNKNKNSGLHRISSKSISAYSRELIRNQNIRSFPIYFRDPD